MTERGSRNAPDTGVDTDPPTTPVPAQSETDATTTGSSGVLDPNAPVEPATVPAPRTSAAQPGRPSVARTRVSGTWVAVIIAAIVLVFLLIFILQNLSRATVYIFGAAGTLPLGVALLLAAVGGALLVALIGTARILQLRRTTRRLRRH
jgi:uncharacterized integral membrane protein